MKQTLGIIGLGAFGVFMAKHLAPHFDLCLYDSRDGIATHTLEGAARCDIVVLAVPVTAMAAVVADIAPHLKPGQLVMDVASVKMIPADIMSAGLPAGVDIIGLHPLFGPKSGRDGIAGLNISVCNIRGARAECVSGFLRDTLRLNVIATTPDTHDHEMAWSQALTHIIARAVKSINPPEIKQTTRTYAQLKDMIDTISTDSDELFRAIQKFNPHAGDVNRAFFEALRKIEDSLN